MQRIMVDLPEPDGPQTTTRSFSATVMRHVAQHVQRAEPLVDLVHHDDGRRLAVDQVGDDMLGKCGLAHGPILVQRRSARLSSRSRPRLYFDMAKQKAM